jgi:large subunit ribosomal protein L7Ae
MGKGDDKKPVKKGAAKAVPPAAPAKKPAAVAKQNWKQSHSHLFEKTPRVFKVGRAILPAKRDLSRYVKWPKYIRLQRQRAILLKRLKVPPAINQFTTTIDKNQAGQLFQLLAKYRPETKLEKADRLKKKAAGEVGAAAAAGAGAGSKKGQQAVSKAQKPKLVKYGINHIATLVEQKKAKLVVIAHDVDPIELVVWLPALCRKFDVPYCIVKGKGRLGQVVHKKTATALALVDVNKEDFALLDQLKISFANLYSDAGRTKKGGGGIMGHKAVIKQKKLAEVRAKEAAKKLKA